MVARRGGVGQWKHMYGETLLEHFRNPRNVGKLEAPTAHAAASNPACGDRIELGVAMEAGRVAAVRYQVRGCTASIAAGSALTTLMEGRTREELARIDAAAVEAALGELPAASKHAALLCADALRSLLRQLP